MNLSNRLTVFRLATVPLILALLLWRQQADTLWARLAASFSADMLFIAAAISDYWDGKLARRHGWITNFGKLMDPLADKVLVIVVFTALVEMRIFAAWMVAIIIFREFLVTGVRLLAAQQGMTIAAESAGKIKAGWQLATIITVLSFLWFHDLAAFWGVQYYVNPFPLREGDPTHVPWIWWIGQVMMLITLWFTVSSGWQFIRRNRQFFMQDQL